MKKFSGQKDGGTETHGFAIVHIACCLLPMIHAYHESNEDVKDNKSGKPLNNTAWFRSLTNYFFALFYIDKEQSARQKANSFWSAAVALYMGIDTEQGEQDSNIKPFALISFLFASFLS